MHGPRRWPSPADAVRPIAGAGSSRKSSAPASARGAFKLASIYVLAVPAMPRLRSNPPAMITIRTESPEDYPEIREVLIQAFGRPDEANLVEALRREENYLIELALVGLVNETIVAH